MHPHQQLLTRLFQCLNAHDHKGMAECYCQEATFRDIAFDLKGKQQIHAMWEMICAEDEHGARSDIECEVRELSAGESTGKAVVVDRYSIRSSRKEPKPKVVNTITSTFVFREGLILRQTDDCDPVDWARQAFGGGLGFVMGHFGLVRRCFAMRKLKRDIARKRKAES